MRMHNTRINTSQESKNNLLLSLADEHQNWTFRNSAAQLN